MKETAKKTTSQKISDFLMTKQKTLFIALAVVIVVIAAVGVISVVATNKSAEVANKTVKLIELFDEVNISDDETNDEFIEYANTLISECKGSNAEMVAYSKLGSYYFDKENFEEALVNYENAYKLFPNDMANSVYMFNAAMTLEELDRKEDAIGTLEALVEKYKDLDDKDLTADVPEAIFNLGRLYEAVDNKEKAVENYELLVAEYQSYNLAAVAKTRLISIK